jgi:outer membrane lipase/esterase
MLYGSHKYKECQCLLWLVLLLWQCFFGVNANVVVQSLTQSPVNPVIEGSMVTNAVTEFNSDAEIFPKSVSTAELSFTSSPGRQLSPTFTVIDSSPGSISAGLGFVDSVTLPASGGEIIHTIDIPSEAVVGENITDLITISDPNQVQSRIPDIVVIVTVSSDLTNAELEMAEALDVACVELSISNALTEEQANLLAICNQLDSLDPATRLSALQKITPTQIPAQADLSFRSSHTQLNNVNARMTALRSGTSVNSVAGLNLQYAGLTLPAELFLASQNHLAQGLDADAEIQRFVPKMGMFVSGNVSFGEKEDVVDELGFDFNTAGMTVGIDYRLSHAQIAGGAVGIVNSDSDFNGSRGNTDIRGLSLLAYSTYYLNQSSYLEAVFSFGKNNFDNSRNIVAGPINAVVSGETDGTETSISLGVGYDFSQGSYSFSPYGKINYIHTEIDGYSESSNTGLELTYDDQVAKSMTVNIGGQFSYAISQNYGVILPTLRFDWMHEYKDDSRFITAGFLNDPTQGKFNIKSAIPDTDYFKLGIGASATFQGGRSAFIFYESLLGQNNVTQESVSGGFRWVF